MSITISLPDLWLERYEKIAEGNRFRLGLLKQLWDRCDAAGVQLLPLKGIDLVLRAYSGKGLRPMYDLDLLIQPNQHRALSKILHEMDYLPKPPARWLIESFRDEEAEYVARDRSLSLDITLGIWYVDDMAPIWSRVVSRETPIGMRFLLHPEDALLYLAAYVVAHRGQLSAIFVQDLDAFLAREKQTINWTLWTAEVKRRQLQTAIFHGLDYAVRKGVTQIPEPVLPALSPQTLSEKCQLFYYRRAVTEHPRPSVNYLFPLVTAPGWRGKKRLLRRIFSPPAQTAELRGLQSGGRLRSTLRVAIKGLQLLPRCLVVLPREIYQLFQ